MPASAEATKKVTRITRSTSMPMKVAASRSWAVARMALPNRRAGHPLDPAAEQPGPTDRLQHHQTPRQARRDDRDFVVHQEPGDAGGQEGAHHVDVAVREIQHLEDAVDQRIAKGDQRIEASQLEAIDQLLWEVLQEIVHGNQKGDGMGPSPSFLLL